MDIHAFVKQMKPSGGGRGGGGSADFLKVSRTGKYTLRLFTFIDPNGEPQLGYPYYDHRLGQRSSDVCAKHWDEDAICEHCNDVGALYDEGTKEARQQANGQRAKLRFWVCAVDVNGTANSSPDNYGIWDRSGGAMQQIMGKIAMVGGWHDDEIDTEDDDCLACLEAGLEQCTGPNGRDLIVTTNEKGGPTGYYKYKFSSKPGKELALTLEDTPDMGELFRRIKGPKDQDDEEQKPARRKPSAPKPKAKAKKAKAKPKTKRKVTAKKKVAKKN